MREENIVVYSFTNKCITFFFILEVFYSALSVLKVCGRENACSHFAYQIMADFKSVFSNSSNKQ